MSTFLSSLVARTAETGRTLQPRLPSVYEPVTGRAALPVFAPPTQADVEPDAFQTAAVAPAPAPSDAAPEPETAAVATTAGIAQLPSQPPSLRANRPKRPPKTDDSAAKSPLPQVERKVTPPPIVRAPTVEKAQPERVVVEKFIEQPTVSVEKDREPALQNRPDIRPRRSRPPSDPSNELTTQIREELRAFLANLEQREPANEISDGRPDLPPVPNSKDGDRKPGLQTNFMEPPLLTNRPAAPLLRPEMNGEKGGAESGKRPENRQQPILKTERKIQVINPLQPDLRPNQPPQPIDQPEPTIEVHIGRIEVRAAPPPDDSKTRRKTKTAVMNLDDYLKQRNGQGKRR